MCCSLGYVRRAELKGINKIIQQQIFSLFCFVSRAWASSGGAIYPSKPRTESELEFRSFMENVGCKDADCLRQVNAEKLVTSVQDTWRKPQPDLPGKVEDPTNRHQWLVSKCRLIMKLCIWLIPLKALENGYWMSRHTPVKSTYTFKRGHLRDRLRSLF